ncbi:MAG: hypothetical protein HYU80_01610 [Candidatus Blackburnbacteria bacterium]|nr:hypothetical protein [Candidatus Blackburnbacteria bacterium]
MPERVKVTEQRLAEAREIETEARRYLREEESLQPPDEVRAFTLIMNVPPVALPFVLSDRQQLEETLVQAMGHVGHYVEKVVLLTLAREVGVAIAQAAFLKGVAILPLDQLVVPPNPGLVAAFGEMAEKFKEEFTKGREDAILKFVGLLREGVRLERRAVIGDASAVDTPTRIPGVYIRYTQDAASLEQVRSIVISP